MICRYCRLAIDFNGAKWALISDRWTACHESPPDSPHNFHEPHLTRTAVERWLRT